MNERITDIYDVTLTRFEYGSLRAQLAVLERLLDSLLADMEISASSDYVHIPDAEAIVKAIFPEQYAERVAELKGGEK